MISQVQVSATEDGIRLHRWFGRHYQGANMLATRKLCRSGEIRVNSKRCTEKDILKSGDLIRVPPIFALHDAPRAPSPSSFTLADLEFLRQRIIHSDDDIAVFNKPAGMAVQGGNGIRKSLDKMAAALFPNDSVLLVHRLDKETSGVIVVAKNQNAAQRLASEFQSKKIRKEYIAVLSGGVSPIQGIIDDPIDGKNATTEYRVLGGLKKVLSFVRFIPMTGRKHQLRKHSAFVLNAPIVGDDLYGSRRLDGRLKTFLSAGRLYLFAEKITFSHPKTGKLLTISAVMPEWIASVAKLCEIDGIN